MLVHRYPNWRQSFIDRTLISSSLWGKNILSTFFLNIELLLIYTNIFRFLDYIKFNVMWLSTLAADAV